MGSLGSTLVYLARRYFRRMLRMFLFLTVSSIFPADGVIREQLWAFSYHAQVTACAENELVEGHRWQEHIYFCSWLHLWHCLEDDWFMHIMSQSSPIQNKWKGYMWRLCVKHTTDETVCYEIWIKKEKDSVKRWPFPQATSFWWFISSSPFTLFLSFFLNSNYLSLGHQVDTFCDASPCFFIYFFLKGVCYFSAQHISATLYFY